MRECCKITYVYGEHKTAYDLLEVANGKRQTRRNHDHVVTSAVCRKRES